jgi:flagellar motor switch protein FliG
MDINKLPGPLKFAILIKSLGKERAQLILARLSVTERNIIEKHLSQMGSISPDIVKKVSVEFVQMIERAKALQLKQSNKPATVNGKEADGNKDSADSGVSNMDAIQSLGPERIVSLIKDEHPQTIAVILVHFNSDVAGRVLTKLPDDVRPGVAIRIANLDKVRAEMVKEVDLVFEEILKDSKSDEVREVGGVERLADILNQIDGDAGQVLMDEIEEIDPELASAISQRRFMFEDLTLVDDRGLQKVMRNVESKDLAVALKVSSDEVKEKIFKNMSERAADMLREEIDSLGAVRMKEVEDAQLVVTTIIQDMDAKGEIVISGRGGEDFV